MDGSAVNVGVDNGSPVSLERFKADRRKAFYGKALIILQNNGADGAATLTAASPGLATAKTIINSIK